MTHSPRPSVRSDSALMDNPRLRPCLRCQAEFHSGWAGERICSRCKGSTAWRNGSPLRTSATGGRG